MNSHSGSIHIIFGPMFSGKSSEMFRQMRRYTVAKKKCLVIKYTFDTRYAVDEASTHDQFKMDATPAVRLYDVLENAMKHDVIGIDEGQFFPDVVEFSEQMANAGKTVVIAALDGTFQRKAFGRVVELIALAESVTKLTSVCMVCQNPAAFSKRLGSETAVEVIGGADKYIAVCRSCYFSDQLPEESMSPQDAQTQTPSTEVQSMQNLTLASPAAVSVQSTSTSSPMAASSSSLDLTASSTTATDMFSSPVAKRVAVTAVDTPIA